MREPEVAFAMKELAIIEARRLERHCWHELWPYRELFQVLTWCDLSVPHRQTAIGAI
jgi:lipopolysaccharide transport system permease protein